LQVREDRAKLRMGLHNLMRQQMEIYGNEVTLQEGKKCSYQPLLISSTKIGPCVRLENSAGCEFSSSFQRGVWERHRGRNQKNRVTQKQEAALRFAALTKSFVWKTAPLALFSFMLM